MRHRVHIYFWFRKNRSGNSEGLIYCRLSVGGNPSRVEMSTGITTDKSAWDASAGKLLGNTAAVERDNRALIKLKDEFNDIHAELEHLYRPVTPHTLLRRYKDGAGTVQSLLELYATFADERRQLVSIEIVPSTYHGIQTRHKHLKKFLAFIKRPDLRPEEFNVAMADRYWHWLLAIQRFRHNTAVKSLQGIGQVLRWCVRREVIGANPLQYYEYKPCSAKPILYLTAEELTALTAYHFEEPRLDRARDFFLFQCWTGLAYSDLAALDVAANAYQHGAQRVLKVIRAKSTLYKGYECTIPLLPEAERILRKYGDKLAVPDNQIYNRHLKLIGELLGISREKMCTHIGRKTAGVTLLNAGVRMEVVSKFLGHSSVKITESTYAFILDKTVVEEFERVFPDVREAKTQQPPRAPRQKKKQINPSGAVNPAHELRWD
jgi:integrase/recombinase XerD